MPNLRPLERREFLFDVSAGESERGHIITGRPIVYGQRTNIGLFDEIIEPGALDKTDLRDVRFLVNHNLSMIPLARSRRNNGNSTMLLSPDTEGMAIQDVSKVLGHANVSITQTYYYHTDEKVEKEFRRFI